MRWSGKNHTDEYTIFPIHIQNGKLATHILPLPIHALKPIIVAIVATCPFPAMRHHIYNNTLPDIPLLSTPPHHSCKIKAVNEPIFSHY